MIYGDGCFKDPIGGIWEFADPVVSPGFTKGLNGTPLSAPSFVPEEYVFNNANKKQMIIFDKEFDERSVELNQNEIIASTIKKLSDFDLNDEESLKTLSNFRLVPGTTSLFRTYHP